MLEGASAIGVNGLIGFSLLASGLVIGSDFWRDEAGRRADSQTSSSKERLPSLPQGCVHLQLTSIFLLTSSLTPPIYNTTHATTDSASRPSADLSPRALFALHPITTLTRERVVQSKPTLNLKVAHCIHHQIAHTQWLRPQTAALRRLLLPQSPPPTLLRTSVSATRASPPQTRRRIPQTCRKRRKTFSKFFNGIHNVTEDCAGLVS